MSADSGLRQLEYIAKVDNAEFLAAEQVQQAQSGGVRERRHAGKEGLRLRVNSIHHYIRMNC